MRSTLRLLSCLLMLAAASLTGCAAFTPVALTDAEISDRAKRDLGAILNLGEPIEAPINLYGAMARALQFNLDHRLEVARKALSLREAKLARLGMLPELVAGAGVDSRNSLPASSSILFSDERTESLAPSFSRPESVFDAELKLSWNLLDFGLSYVRARQAGDRMLAAEEQRRRIMQRIVHDVRVAYWRAVSADWAISRARLLEGRIQKALRASRRSRAKRIAAPLTTLTYERELIGLERELRELQRDLTMGKIQLAALMNVHPGQHFVLSTEDPQPEALEFSTQVSEMQVTALQNRPELREVAYEERINEQEGRALLLELLPGIELGIGAHYNDNQFLVHQDWLSLGARATQQLLRLFTLPGRLAKIRAAEELLDAQRLALTMAVLTQVHVSKAAYEHARSEYETAASFEETQNQILDQVRTSARANRTTEQALIREEMNTLVASVKLDMAYADLEGAYAEAYVAMGVDPLPESLEVASLPELTTALERSYAAR